MKLYWGYYYSVGAQSFILRVNSDPRAHAVQLSLPQDLVDKWLIEGDEQSYFFWNKLTVAHELTANTEKTVTMIPKEDA